MPKKSVHEWALEHFERKDGNKYLCKGHAECKYVTERHPANMRGHLKRMHNIGTPEKKRQRTLTEYVAIPALSWEETVACAFACNGWSFNSASSDNDFLKQVVPRLPCRKTVAKASMTAAAKLMRFVLPRLGVVTLCYDSGTVHNRYLLVVAATPTKTVVMRCRRFDTDMTSEAINEVLQEVRSCIESHGGYVIAQVADNAAGMQSDGIIGPKLRCAAHVFQLAMKDCATRIADCKDACQIVDRLADEGQKITRMPETRWSYLAARLQSGLEVIPASSRRSPNRGASLVCA
jgi:hypothetical protein